MSGEQKSEVRHWNGKITVPHPASRFKSAHTLSTHWLKRSQIPLRKIFAMATQQFLREILIFFQMAIIIYQHNDSGNRATSRFGELGIFQKKIWDNTDTRGPKMPYGLLDKMGAKEFRLHVEVWLKSVSSWILWSMYPLKDISVAT